MKHIYMEDIKAGRIDKGILGIETDVLYQWRDLVPTYERRLTQIEQVNMTNIKAANVDFVSRILGEEEAPVQNISLRKVTADTIRTESEIHQHVNGFTNTQ